MSSCFSLIQQSIYLKSPYLHNVFEEYVPILVEYTKEDAAINGLRAASSADKEYREPNYFSALEVLDRDKRVILKADSGMGKSTFLKMLALCMSGEIAHEKNYNLDRLTEAIERSIAAGLPEKQNWNAGVLKPFLFEVNLWACEHTDSHKLPDEIYEAQLVLIDGLDEINSDDWKRIYPELQKLFMMKPEVYVVAVGRTDVLNRLRPGLLGFKSYTIKLFTEFQKKRLVRFSKPGLTNEQIEKQLSLSSPSIKNLLNITQNLSWWTKINNFPESIQDFYMLVVEYILPQKDFDFDLLKKLSYKKLLEQPIETDIEEKYHEPLNQNILVEYFACLYCVCGDFSNRFSSLIEKSPYKSWSLIRILKMLIKEQDSTRFLQYATSLCPSEIPDETNKDKGLTAILSAELLFEAYKCKKFAKNNVCEKLKNWLQAIIRNGWLTPYDRIIAGRKLSWLGDDRDYQELVHIPASSFEMGDLNLINNMPVHTVYLQAYKICKFPVVNKDYLLFVTETNRDWISPDRNDPERTNSPAINLTWHDAVAYCEWLTKKWQKEGRISFSEVVRLPTEAEWEFASRGNSHSIKDEFIYSWGNEWKDDYCNSQEFGLNDTCTVGIFPENYSRFGCLDMNGQVWEWNSTLWGSNMKKPDFPYPYDPNDGRENSKNAADNIRRCMRGGSFGSAADHVTSTYRGGLEPIGFWRGDGFRIVVSEITYDK